MKRDRFGIALVAITLAASGGMALAAEERSAVSDAWLTTKAKVAVLTGVGTAGTDVNVDTVDGRVTLHGTVESEADKKTAEDAARGLDGVREVRNLLQVVSAKNAKAVDRADDDLQKDVATALRKDTGLRGSKITVQSVNEGTVLLSGKADSLSDHLRAVETTREVRGVAAVHSEIQSPDREADSDLSREASDKLDDVKAGAKSTAKSLSGAASDAYITSSAKTRLLASSKTPGTDINVDSRNGVVTLFGSVPSKDAMAAAGKEAAKVSGVRKVENKLEVVAADRKEAVEDRDAAIIARIETALDKDAGLKDADIGVEVANGVARLTGTAASDTDKVKAKAIAGKIDGVRSVENEIEIDAGDDDSE